MLEFLKNLKPVKFLMEKFFPGKDKPQTTTKTELVVYVTPNGSRYHSDPDCPSLRHARRVHKMPLSKAKKAGLTACDKCCYSYLYH